MMMFCDIPMSEIRVDAYRAGETRYLRATHLPTGTVVQAVNADEMQERDRLLMRLVRAVRYGVGSPDTETP
jgi:hypothetical protein